MISFDEWVDIGKQAQTVRKELFQLHKKIGGNVPKTVWHNQFRWCLRSLDQLISDLEDRMTVECPSEWDTDVFYGSGIE